MVVTFQTFFIGNFLGEGSYILSPCQLFPHVALLKLACQWGTPEETSIQWKQKKLKKNHKSTCFCGHIPGCGEIGQREVQCQQVSTDLLWTGPRPFMVIMLREMLLSRLSQMQSWVCCTETWKVCLSVVVSYLGPDKKLFVHSNTLSHKVLWSFGILCPTEISLF